MYSNYDDFGQLVFGKKSLMQNIFKSWYFGERVCEKTFMWVGTYVVLRNMWSHKTNKESLFAL